jgi:peptide/nickel transport system permease protein
VVLGSVVGSPSVRLIVKRLWQAIPVMFGVTFLTFSLMNLLPGGTARALAGEGATTQEIQAIAAKLRLNEPFFSRYFHWLGGALSGHLGASLANGQAVSAIIRQRLPVTVELVLLAMILSVGFAIPVAVAAANKPRGIADRISIVLCMFGISVPGFVLGLVLILIFAVHLKILPAIGFTPLSAGLWPNLRTMIMPSSTLAFALFCHYVRVLRADLDDQMAGEDYITTAKAKGITPRKILVRHALRNSMFSMLTLVGLNLGVLIGGTVLIEQIFSLPGIGQELILSVQSEDVIVVEGVVLIVSIAVVLANLITDLLYSALDPRIRYGHSGS